MLAAPPIEIAEAFCLYWTRLVNSPLSLRNQRDSTSAYHHHSTRLGEQAYTVCRTSPATPEKGAGP